MSATALFVSLVVALGPADLAAAQNQAYSNTRVFPRDCATVRGSAEGFLNKLGAHLEPVSGRPDTLSFSLPFRDAEGRRIGRRKAMKKYMGPERFPGDHVYFPWWVAARSKQMKGIMHVAETPEGCEARLEHHYEWYDMLFLLFFPVDGDPAGRPSNNRLESEYLDEIGRLLQRRNAKN